jgi:hypothetical protein
MTNIELARLPDVGDAKPKRRRPKHKPKPQPMSRNKLDGRLGAPKRFEQIVADLTAELGGKLTPSQKSCAEAFAGCFIKLDDLNARMLLGQNVDPATYNTTVSNLMRISDRLGVKLTKDGNEESALTTYLNTPKQEEADNEEDPA